MKFRSQHEHAGQTIHFPDITTFSELFPQTDGITKAPSTTLKRLDAGEAWQDVSGYLDMHGAGGGSFNILVLAPFVMEFIEKEMLRIEYDTIYFKIVNWDDGRALVIVSYGQIIGSRYLAIIDQASIPDRGVPA